MCAAGFSCCCVGMWRFFCWYLSVVLQVVCGLFVRCLLSLYCFCWCSLAFVDCLIGCTKYGRSEDHHEHRKPEQHVVCSTLVHSTTSTNTSTTITNSNTTSTTSTNSNSTSTQLGESLGWSLFLVVHGRSEDHHEHRRPPSKNDDVVAGEESALTEAVQSCRERGRRCETSLPIIPMLLFILLSDTVFSC